MSLRNCIGSLVVVVFGFFSFLLANWWLNLCKKNKKKMKNEIEMWSFHNYSLRCYESYKTWAFITCTCMYVHSSPKIKHKILKHFRKQLEEIDMWAMPPTTNYLKCSMKWALKCIVGQIQWVGERHEHDSATLVLSHLPFQNSPHCDTDLNRRYHDARK